jgi:hypothetical protein
MEVVNAEELCCLICFTDFAVLYFGAPIFPAVGLFPCSHYHRKIFFENFNRTRGFFILINFHGLDIFLYFCFSVFDVDFGKEIFK